MNCDNFFPGKSRSGGRAIPSGTCILMNEVFLKDIYQDHHIFIKKVLKNDFMVGTSKNITLPSYNKSGLLRVYRLFQEYCRYHSTLPYGLDRSRVHV